MDTLLILGDTVTAHVVKVIDTCQPCILKAETNTNELLIILIICLSIVLIVTISGYVIIKWHKESLNANEKYDINILEKKWQIESERMDKEWDLLKLKKEFESKESKQSGS